MPNTTPWLSKKRQWASFWFQPASVDTASPACAPPTPSSTTSIGSIAAIAHLVFGGLAEARHRSRYPVGGPTDELPGIDDRQAEQFHRLRCVGEPGRRLLLADNDGRAAKTLAEFRGEVAHRQDFVAADIDRRGRRIAMRQTTQRLCGRVALPDEIDVAEADVDRLALEDLAGDVVQHAVAHVDRVVEPEQPSGRRILLREILEHALAPDAGLRILARRIGGHVLVRAFAVDRHERIDAAGRERDDP